MENANQDRTENFQEILSESTCCTRALRACGYCWAFILILVFGLVFLEVLERVMK